MRRLSIFSLAAFCLGLFVLSRVVAQPAPDKETGPTNLLPSLSAAETTSGIESSTDDVPSRHDAHSGLTRLSFGLASALASAVPTALADWTPNVERNQIANLSDQLRAAKESFQPMGKADVLARQVASRRPFAGWIAI